MWPFVFSENSNILLVPTTILTFHTMSTAPGLDTTPACNLCAGEHGNSSSVPTACAGLPARVCGIFVGHLGHRFGHWFNSRLSAMSTDVPLCHVWTSFIGYSVLVRDIASSLFPVLPALKHFCCRLQLLLGSRTGSGSEQLWILYSHSHRSIDSMVRPLLTGLDCSSANDYRGSVIGSFCRL